ncbi:MAG: STAS domain-containing protein [Holophagales bacterium]|nr:MAG: STAS domain-containing protein [Holophagales bacterium]
MFQTTAIGNVTTLVAPSELDARNAPAARDYLKKLVEAGASRLVIDLSAVSFIDSSALGALLTALKAARSAGGDVKLSGMTPAVQTIFELTRLFRVFDVFPSAEQAAASF